MQCICMYYELLISNTYKCIMDYSIHNTFEGGVAWRIMCHSDMCGGSEWLGGNAMVDFV